MTEAGAMKEETTLHLYDMQKPRSSREKFIQAWHEKLKHQPCPTLSSRVPEPATGVPIQPRETGDEKQSSHSLSRASLRANENPVYFMTMSDPPCSQVHTNSGDVQAPELGPRLLPAATSCSDPKTSSEEFLEMCVSDLLPEPPERKRPRLLTQNKTMHLEGQEKQASDLPYERPRSPAALEHSHQENTTRMTTPEHPHEVESMQPANISHKEHQHLNQKRSTSPSPPASATQGGLGSVPISCLPPKKRYTRKWSL